MGEPHNATAMYDELYLLFDDYIIKNSKKPNTYESLFRKKEFLQFAKLHGTNAVVTSPKEVIKNKDEIIDELIYAFKLFAKYTKVEDINTKYLKYLLIPYILGVLCYETINMEIRSDRLKDAKLYFAEFISVVNTYNITPVDDYLLDKVDDTSQAMNRRNIKVKRAKDEKKYQDLYDDIIKIKTNMKRGVSQNYNPSCFSDDVEEEQLRELCLSLIKCKCLQTLNMMDLIDTELEVLEMRSRQNDLNKQQQNGQLTNDAKQSHHGQLPQNNHPNGGVKKPWLFTIKKNMAPADMTQMRNYYRDLVFTPAHNLPTISLEECAKIEMEYAVKGKGGVNTLGSDDERGGSPTSGAQKSGALKSGKQNGADDEDEYEKCSEESEKEVMDREWDDWKDMHQKGIGNKNRNVA
ncbi:hypothetical protein PCYB_032800 [Plasmodium cynomolgi strain B]|uniref:Type 2A phosphatase-associated protein 42 n=1 Tax=Plasmodium cynomolgi (strain B) TaxID=1120755 RepID=K6UQ19_PLACD|nr:hypothetical protein PCYB_032800 [Plasmodium cynomolgi strain B]GAB64869.1 hypothetical protein PCYB_032800 [Plasmodium cynomolgi strain B]